MTDSQQPAARDSGRQYRVSSAETEKIDTRPAFELSALEDALKKLSAAYPEHGRIVELRFFDGLTSEETAEALGLSLLTVVRKWNFARAWVRRELSSRPTPGGGSS